MKSLRVYQQEANDEIAKLYAQGKRRLILQMPTGGGKTLTTAALIHRFANAMKSKKILIVVHRDELLNQFRCALLSQHNIVAEPIIAGVKYRTDHSQVYATMVETANNRLKRNPNFFGDVGLVVIDEAHLGNFGKLHSYFPPECLILGLTATPLAASKKHPLKELYDDIIITTDIPSLIAEGALVQNRTYHIKGGVKSEDLKVKNGEFDTAQMSKEYSKGKHIANCVKAYEDKALGTKTIIFNCNVEHSKLVTKAFVDAGYNARHLDGTMSEDERLETLNWFAKTPNAILNNIGILTAGFDEPSIQTVIMNRATLSLPLWLQCTGRGSRPYPGKEYFTIIDLGDNARRHGDWSSEINWRDLFHNPPKPGDKKQNPAPIKTCESCEAIIPINAKSCSFCNTVQPDKPVQYDKTKLELELFDIRKMDHENEIIGANPYRTLHTIKGVMVNEIIKNNMPTDPASIDSYLAAYQKKVQEWCKINKKSYNDWHKRTTGQWFISELNSKKQIA